MPLVSYFSLVFNIGQDLLADIEGQELSLKLHGDGQLASFEGSSGKFIPNYDSTVISTLKFLLYDWLFVYKIAHCMNVNVCSTNDCFVSDVTSHVLLLAGKVYDFISFATQEPDETVFVSTEEEPKIGMRLDYFSFIFSLYCLTFFMFIDNLTQNGKFKGFDQVNLMPTSGVFDQDQPVSI